MEQKSFKSAPGRVLKGISQVNASLYKERIVDVGSGKYGWVTHARRKHGLEDSARSLHMTQNKGALFRPYVFVVAQLLIN
jgi:hypothetical protein